MSTDPAGTPAHRRQLLLDSAIDLLREVGTRGVTHRLVADRAHLTVASSRHHFGTDSGLLHAALHQRLQRWQAEIAAASSSLAVSGPDIPTIVDRYFQARLREDLATYLAVFGTAVTVEALQPSVHAAVRQAELLLELRLRRLGLAAPDRLSQTVLMMMFGAATRRRVGLYADAEEAAILTKGLSDLIAGHVAGTA